jgi:RNA polymerase subunit RPABC4/transcription elongation factor Spt4
MSLRGKKHKILVCRKCHCVYETRKSKNKAKCPRCGRPHHTGRIYTGLVIDNHKFYNKFKKEGTING